MPTLKTIIVSGIIGGSIWMPAATCGKSFRVSDAEYPWSKDEPPTLRDMVLRITNDGDFQSCNIADATVQFNRTRTLPNGETITRTRCMDIRDFPSVSDCVVELESKLYWEILDCFSEPE